MIALRAQVGGRLRARRRALGLTLKGLAERSGLSQRYVVLAEKGEANLSLDKAAQLAAALDLRLAALVSGGTRGEVDSLLAGRAPGELEEVARWLRERFGAPRLVALLGVRGAGKSTVGAAVARALSRPFVELDAQVESRAGLSLAEIFSVHGEPYYRRLEAEALEALIDGGSNAVVATGGSIVTHSESFARLSRAALTVWLRARPEDHWERVLRQGDRRPMRDHPRALAELRALLEARAPLYGRADRVVETSGRPASAVVAEIVEALAVPRRCA